MVGFQTLRDRRNFIQALNEIHHRTIKTEGRGTAVSVSAGERSCRLGVFPISIDVKDFARKAATKEVAFNAWHIHRSFPDRQIILGVDRLDYTKGIPHRLEAFATLLQKRPNLHEKLSLVQVVVPSREEVAEYQGLKSSIERLVGEINGRFTSRGWVPIHFLYRSLDREDLIAHYRAADIGLVTPLRDGMNLVAKEYCTCSLEENSVLVLSEFAGAAAELQRGAVLVNPYDVEGVADALYEAVAMPTAERRARMRRMRRLIGRRDVFWWVNSFLLAAFARRLEDFPSVDESPLEYRIADGALTSGM
jgi:trehalose 6-phosphate synthase